MRSKRMLCLMLCALLLVGCTSAPQESAAPLPRATLPAVASGYSAPIGDAGLSYESIAALCLPSRDGQQLLTFYETLTFSYSLHPAETILRALLAHEGNSRVRSCGGNAALALVGSDPVEVAGGVATVNLSASALQLSQQDFYTACLSITATLTALEDVNYVNVLVAGHAVAMDAAGYLPMGSLTAQPGQELPVLWEQLTARRTPVGEKPTAMPLTAAAALYFPLADGSGIIPETRRLTFTGQHPQQLVLGLLEALSAGADTLSSTADFPDLTALMAAAPEITDLNSGGRRVTLAFSSDLRSWLTAAGADPACAYAAIVHTLTTFIPSLEQVCILTGDRAVTAVQHPEHGSLLFSGGIQKRADYSGYLMAQAAVCHASENQLVLHTTALPYRSVRSPRTLLLTLADSPETCTVLPAGLTDADILGLSVSGDTLLINLSARYADIIRESGMDQRMMAYAIVNTMCSGLGVRRVRFFFSSSETESLGSSLVWSGEFLENPGMVHQ